MASRLRFLTQGHVASKDSYNVSSLKLASHSLAIDSDIVSDPSSSPNPKFFTQFPPVSAWPNRRPLPSLACCPGSPTFAVPERPVLVANGHSLGWLLILVLLWLRSSPWLRWFFRAV